MALSSGAGLAVAAQPGGGEPPPPAAAPLTWADCGGGFQCATTQVPLDYRTPDDGRTISLALIRRPVADPAKRVGTLFLQPGGPGGSGVSFVRGNYADLPADLRDRFDVFGFDARGVGKSSPLECFDDARYTQAVTEAKGRPGEQDAVARALREAAEFNAACVEKAGDLLPFIGTEYVARDIDRLRASLGEDEITFYGRSFGTYIGTVYANLFPARVRAMALDGGYDPVRYANRPHAYDRPQYLALDGAMNRFLDWCDATPAMCPFGDGDSEAAYERLLRNLDAEPVPIPDRGTANGYTVAYRLLFSLNEGKAMWPALGTALRQAEQRDSRSLLLSPPSPASFDFLTPNVAVECADREYPRGLRTLERRLVRNTADAPLLGPPIGFGPPTYDHNHAPACVQWPAERISRYDGSYRAEGSPPILVIGTTGDPDTPYQDAIALSEILDNASLVTFQAEGHTAFGRSPCATAAVTTYLAHLVVPRSDTVCADEPPPVPVTPPAATSAPAPTTPPTPTTAPAPPAPPASSELIYGVDESMERMRSPRRQ